jgi:curved DNA-binding protein CbpA
VNEDPFETLGLPQRADLSDDDVRAAWRRIAAATHPDRDDGGDPARFGAAAAAYAMLRTAYGRTEALADLADRGSRSYVGTLRRYSPKNPHVNESAIRAAGAAGGGRRRMAKRGRGEARRARGRGGVLALRVVVAAAVCAGAFLVAGWAPATVGVIVGALTWLIATGRHDVTRA